jgi:4-hydroxythreonine-4-phosphate dehydrogenase
MGDAAGVGPELLVRWWWEESIREHARLVAVGSVEVLRAAASRFAPGRSVRRIGRPEESTEHGDVIDCIEPDGIAELSLAQVGPGKVDARAGRAAYLSLIEATDLARLGRVDAIVTLPLCKESLHLAGIRQPGHTEILAERCNAPGHAMMLYVSSEVAGGPWGLGVAHVTLHMALRDVPERVTVELVEQAIVLADRGLRALGCPAPRIGVAALNPHAGENGHFGDEERAVIEPAIDRKKREGFGASGPFAADTLFSRARGGEFDAIVAMYHDQGHVALKTIGFERAVNITLGLPIVRTSVAHGTAFDIAWTGQARGRNLIEAVRTAARIVAQRAERVGASVT